VKFYNGKFLDNERKDNEILILRQENEIIKKDIEKFNKINKLNEDLKINYITKINELNDEVEKLNKKLETKSNGSYSGSNYYNNSNVSSANKNINSQDSNLLSKLAYKTNINEINNFISSSISHKKKFDYLKGLKKIFQKVSIKSKKSQNNFNITKSLYLNSNNYLRYNCSTVNTSGQNIFTVNYDKICSTDKIKRISKNRNKYYRNYSNIQRVRPDDINNSFSLNKYIRKMSHSKHRNGRKTNHNKKKNSNNNIKSLRPIESCPMSCRNKLSSIGKKNCK